MFILLVKLWEMGQIEDLSAISTRTWSNPCEMKWYKCMSRHLPFTQWKWYPPVDRSKDLSVSRYTFFCSFIIINNFNKWRWRYHRNSSSAGSITEWIASDSRGWSRSITPHLVERVGRHAESLWGRIHIWNLENHFCLVLFILAPFSANSTNPTQTPYIWHFR